jgi:hypothetical protein
MNMKIMKMKRLVAGATIAAALGGTATGIGAGISSAAPARPPTISTQVGHAGPPPQAGPGGPGGSPSPQDHPGGPGGPPADNRGPGRPRCPASASVEWTTPAAVRAAATAIRLLGIHRDTGMGSRFQPVGLLAVRGLDPALTAKHKTVALLSSPARRPSSVAPRPPVRTGRRAPPDDRPVPARCCV